MPNKIIAVADFDAKYRGYILLSGTAFLAITIVGIILIPIWLLGLGQ